ncbi:MAG: cardiolipin synthase [Paracoccaceae bacterium]|jgi:cardiolipin synthase
MWVFLSGLVVFAFYAVATWFAFQAAATARTPQGAMGWVVFLLAIPFMAVPAYLFLGHHRFRGYRIARRESERVVAGIRDFATQYRPAPDATPINLRPFEQIAGMPAIRGNGVDLLINGQVAFDAMFQAIDAAQSYVLVQFYIVRNDGLGLKLQQKLIAAAGRGVSVLFMTDAVGSHALPTSYSDTLRAAGVRVVDRASARGPKFRFQINYRNHRKTVIVDGHTGFVGGLNVGDEYLGLGQEFGTWRDTHVRLRGPVVLQLQLIFVEDWHWVTDEPLLGELTWQTANAPENMTALITATGPGDETEAGSLMFFSAIAAAQHRVWIASPYFVPDFAVMGALNHAAMRGLDVRILVPEKADHMLSWLAAFTYFDDVMAAGVRVFRYTNGFMHQKVFLIDDHLTGVGTTNLDNRSFRLNFETMALFFDPRAAAATKAMLQADFENAYEMTLTIDQQPRLIRLGAPLARLFSPLL